MAGLEERSHRSEEGGALLLQNSEPYGFHHCTLLS